MRDKTDRFPSSRITLTPPIQGFESFLSLWLYQGDVTILVDVGPASTSQKLITILKEKNIHAIDFILLTHVHLDHAGGICRIWNQFPESRVICHPSAKVHLMDPKRLWEGSLNTLGDIAKAYGPPEAIPRECIITSNDFRSGLVDCIPTPGHAEHHVSYMIEDTLFAGEACGVILPLGTDRPYMRPATPPRLLLELFLKSLDKLIGKKPFRVCCGHYGVYENGSSLLAAHKDQLLRWESIVANIMNQQESDDPIQVSLDQLLISDHLLKGLEKMMPRVKERELFFLKNSIRGFIGYIQEKALKNE
jgi:glyoxylase-like metal-dependent hydrolase (beta-lactamase superfamily II)